VPDVEILREETIGTRASLIEQRVRFLELALKEHRASIEARLRDGAQTFSDQRTELARLHDRVDSKVSTRAATVAAKTAEVEAKLEVKIAAVGGEIKKLAEDVAPRATPLRIAGWIAAFLAVVGSPIGSAIYFGARAPDRGELRELEQRVRVNEGRITVLDTRVAAQGARP